jgi:hypothetical protein
VVSAVTLAAPPHLFVWLMGMGMYKGRYFATATARLVFVSWILLAMPFRLLACQRFPLRLDLLTLLGPAFAQNLRYPRV